MRFGLHQARRGVESLLAGDPPIRLVTLAQATLPGRPAAARLQRPLRGGAGPCLRPIPGPLAAGVTAFTCGRAGAPVRLEWEDPRLLFAVREPFVSRQSEAGLVAGLLEPGEGLVLESRMPSGGVIFSDGMQQGFLDFKAGATVEIRSAGQQARLVLPGAA